ncbi:lipopolysaccharide biosynthesis protein [Virgibacillus sediminis]|uniref:Lipopolysaccharide biosynthesis protein n=1 Tax=Virgibacillus sediminis TaxID=202260 RepID=A0ABV7A3R4_9BACI
MEIIKRYKNKLQQNRFIKNVLILVGGTVFAQGLVVLSSPILTRLYTPEAFGILATFISIVSILNSVVSLKYELALPLTRTHKETMNLFSFNVMLLTLISLGYLLIFLTFGDYIFSKLGLDSYLNLLIWLIPLTVLFLGFTTNITHLFIKIDRFKSITAVNVNSIVAKVILQLGFGVLIPYNFGLIIGDSLGRFIGNLLGFYLMIKSNLLRSYQEAKSLLSVETMKRTAVYFKKFPLYSMPAGLINSLSSHLTPIVLTFAYDPVVAGFYSLTQRVLGMPSSLVSQSISQVYLNEAPKLLEKDISLVKKLYLKVTKNLLLFGGIPIVLLAVFGEGLFSMVFGEKWSDSGIYLQALALMFIGQFTVVPLSQTLNILNRQNIQLLWDIGRVVLSIITIIVSAKFLHLGPALTLFIYSVSMFLLYVVLYFISLYFLNNNQVASKEEIR